MGERPDDVVARELQPGVFVYQVEPEPPSATRRTVNGRVAHAKQTALAIRDAVAARKK